MCILGHLRTVSIRIMGVVLGPYWLVLFALNCACKYTCLVLCCAMPMQALAPNNQPLSPVSAAKLSQWICEGPKGKGNGIDGRLNGLLHPSHTVILWAAAACRVCRNNLFTTDYGGDLGCAGTLPSKGLSRGGPAFCYWNPQLPATVDQWCLSLTCIQQLL
jgi:hypothetical protein